MFQMNAIALVSEINHYHINGLHLFLDTLYIYVYIYIHSRIWVIAPKHVAFLILTKHHQRSIRVWSLSNSFLRNSNTYPSMPSTFQNILQISFQEIITCLIAFSLILSMEKSEIAGCYIWNVQHMKNGQLSYSKYLDNLLAFCEILRYFLFCLPIFFVGSNICWTFLGDLLGEGHQKMTSRVILCFGSRELCTLYIYAYTVCEVV